MKDNLFTKEEARTRLARGIRKAAEAVGATMGTGGSNAIIEAIEAPGHMTTNDGATILSSIHFEDPLEEMGKNILLEAVSRANKQSGDGSSTTTVLTASIIEEGLKHIGKTSPMALKRALEACIPIIEESLRSQSKLVSTGQIKAVASISAEDEQIGELIQEIYEKIGKEGIIYWDVSKTPEDTYTIGTGLTIRDAGWFSPYMCDAQENGQSTNQIKIKNPHILITKQKISTAGDFNNIAQALNQKEIKDLVVFCDDVDPLVVPDLIKTRAIRGFRIILVKMPVLWKDEWYEDLSIASGATLLDPITGIALKDATPVHLGTFGYITITKTDTYVDGIQDLTSHIEKLKAGDEPEQVRSARLNTKTARYYVGAHSESALAYRRLKVEDAISASYHALRGGIVAGGGSALASIKTNNEILDYALKQPAKQIALNVGHDLQIGSDYQNGRGFNSKTCEFVDMFEAGIVDATEVVVNAVKNAISVAAAVLTVSTVVTLPREAEQAQPNALIR